MDPDVQAFLDVGLKLKKYETTKPAELKGGKVVAVSKNIFEMIKKPWQKFSRFVDEKVFYDEKDEKVQNESLTETEELEVKALANEIQEKYNNFVDHEDAKKYLLKLKSIRIDAIFTDGNMPINKAKVVLLDEQIPILETKIKNNEVQFLENSTLSDEKIADEKIEAVNSVERNDGEIEKPFENMEEKESEPAVEMQPAEEVKPIEPPEEIQPVEEEKSNEEIQPVEEVKTSEEIQPVEEVQVEMETPVSEKKEVSKREMLEIELSKYMNERRACVLELKNYENKFDSIEKDKLKQYFAHLSTKIDQLNKELKVEIEKEEELKRNSELIKQAEEQVAEKNERNEANIDSYMREKTAVEMELKKYENVYMSEEKDRLLNYLETINQKIQELAPEKVFAANSITEADVNAFNRDADLKKDQMINEIVAEIKNDDISADTTNDYVEGEAEVEPKSELDAAIESLEVISDALERQLYILRQTREREKVTAEKGKSF